MVHGHMYTQANMHTRKKNKQIFKSRRGQGISLSLTYRQSLGAGKVVQHFLASQKCKPMRRF